MTRDPDLRTTDLRMPFILVLLLALCAGGGSASADGTYAPRQPQDVFIDQPPTPTGQQAGSGRQDCPDPGSWGVVDGPAPPPGRPLVAQGWDGCADLPGRGPRPNINVEVMIDPTQNGNGQNGDGLDNGGMGDVTGQTVPRRLGRPWQGGGFMRGGGGSPGGFVR
jgi:hypothetical protein